MSAFGLARALHPSSAWSDARILFTFGTWVCAAAALLLWKAPACRRFRVFQVLLVLPSGALTLTTGGHDMPVIACLLLAIVLQQSGRPTASALAVSSAALMKLTAWPLLLFLGGISVRQHRRFEDRRLASTVVYSCLVAALLLTMACAPVAMVTDTLLFPLGLTGGTAPPHSPSIGSAVLKAAGAEEMTPPAQMLLSGVLIIVAVLLAYLCVRRRQMADASDAARSAGLSMAALLLLAPGGRPGLWLYPLNLLLWSALMREKRDPEPGTIAALRGGRRT